MTPAILCYRKFRILERNIHPELLFSSSWPLVGQCQMHLKAAHNPKPCTTTHKIRVKTTVYRNFVQSFQKIAASTKEIIRSGEEIMQSGKEITRSGKESIQSEKEIAQSGREIIRSGREIARSEKANVQSGQEMIKSRLFTIKSEN